MSRALGHEGVAATTMFDLWRTGRTMTSDERVAAMAAFAVVANTMGDLRRLAQLVTAFLTNR